MNAIMKPRIVIQFACTAKEKRQIQKAAKRRKETVSQWLRRTAGNHVAIESRWEPNARCREDYVKAFHPEAE